MGRGGLKEVAQGSKGDGVRAGGTAQGRIKMRPSKRIRMSVEGKMDFRHPIKIEVPTFG